MAILGVVDNSTVAGLTNMRLTAQRRFAELEGAPDPGNFHNGAAVRFTAACQEAALIIQDRVGRAARGSAAFHVLCNSTPPTKTISRQDFDGFNLSTVLLRVVWHLRKGTDLETCLAPVIACHEATPPALPQRPRRPSGTAVALPHNS